MKTIVVDASAAMEIVKNSPQGAEFYNWIMHADKVIAPMLFCVEACNSIWKYAMFSNEEIGDAHQNLTDSIGLIDEFYSEDNLILDVYDFAIKNKHSVYDCIYVVLAKQQGAGLLSADKKLKQLCAENDIEMA